MLQRSDSGREVRIGVAKKVIHFETESTHNGQRPGGKCAAHALRAILDNQHNNKTLARLTRAKSEKKTREMIATKIKENGLYGCYILN